ncbi:MAG TPA: hypothetical protein PLJ47_14655 [Candidatus Hydrogenedentes bacterium]|mgnify:CR=1 FL=1|nr:hypothetical protein [Candidatus Hydrogenedentota bacterium]
MLEKPAEWRRFEPVELEGSIGRATSRAMAPVLHESTSSLVREFERVLRENERLKSECAELRTHAAKSGNETVRFQEDLDAARSELARLQANLEDQRASARETTDLPPAPENVSMPANPSNALRQTAEVVAGYLFSDPTGPQIRLVEDALRARGL